VRAHHCAAVVRHARQHRPHFAPRVSHPTGAAKPFPPSRRLPPCQHHQPPPPPPPSPHPTPYRIFCPLFRPPSPLSLPRKCPLPSHICRRVLRAGMDTTHTRTHAHARAASDTHRTRPCGSAATAAVRCQGCACRGWSGGPTLRTS
jgi:hypothetical protein